MSQQISCNADRRVGRSTGVLCFLKDVVIIGWLAVFASAGWFVPTVFAAEIDEDVQSPPALRERLPTPEEFKTHREQLGWCTYPIARPRKPLPNRKAQTLELAEIEPNDMVPQAQFIALSSEIDSEVDFVVTGSISPGNDVDYYSITAEKGDIIGVSVVSTEWEEFLYSYTFWYFYSYFSWSTYVPLLDPIVGIYDSAGVIYHENDDDYFVSYLYPEESPLPGGYFLTDAMLSFVVPEDGDYLLGVTSFASASCGDYEMTVVMRRPQIEADAIGEQQIIYLDFDGVGFINPRATWGDGWWVTSTSPLRDFLWYWGLNLEDEAVVVQAIIDVVEENFDDLRQARLNGDRDSQLVDGQYDVEIRNSRDHPDPWGEPNVSRVIIGGTMDEIGIGTLGIAESIDPGNFNREETAIVLLDYLSSPAMLQPLCWDDKGTDDPDDDEYVPCCLDPGSGGVVPCCIVTEEEACEDPEDPVVPYLVVNLDSINAMPRAPGVDIIDAIGQVVGNIATHEAGHYLGLWHTDNSNDVACLIDTGGNGIFDEGGVGPDGIFGTQDDVDVDFIPDDFECMVFDFFGFTYYGECNFSGTELVDTRVAHGCSTGKTSVAPTDPELPPTPTSSVRAIPTAGAAPLIVSFSGGGVDPDGDPFITFTWNFGDGTSGTGANVDHIYTTPGTYMAVLTSVSTDGESATATIRITVTDVPNDPPSPMIAATPTTGEAPLVVLFEGTATDPDGVVVAYQWDFGDGTTASGQMVEHVFTDVGAYGVVLTAIDDQGGRGIATTIIRTSAPSGSTAADIVLPNNNVTPSPFADGFTLPVCGAGVASGFVMSLLGLMLLRRRY